MVIVNGQVGAIAERIRAEYPGHRYVAYHAPRYATLLSLLSKYEPWGDRTTLDIGRSVLTDLIRTTFGISVDTLGFEPDDRSPAGNHYQFDLNHAQDKGRWRSDMPTYDLIVMGEVIEHVHTSPRLVLSFVAQLMAPGGVLVVQTPNAAVLHKRFRLLVGRNPYNLISEDVTSPAHFREYTVRELTDYAQLVGLEVEKSLYGSYFDYRYKGHSKPSPGGWIQSK